MFMTVPYFRGKVRFLILANISIYLRQFNTFLHTANNNISSLDVLYLMRLFISI